MTRFKLLMLIILFSFELSAQNSIKTTVADIKSDVDIRWDLEQFIWSQSHLIGKVSNKQRLNFDDIYNWAQLENDDKDLAISPDGKYISYNLVKGGSLPYKRHDAFIIQEANGSWREALPMIESGFFSGDSKQYIFKTRDSLGFLQLGESKIDYLSGITSFIHDNIAKPEWLSYQLNNSGRTVVLENLFTGKKWRKDNVSRYVLNKTGDWLICQTNNQELILRNLVTQQEKKFPDVIEYNLHYSGKAMLVKSIVKKNNEPVITLQYVDLVDNTISTIWSDSQSDCLIDNASFDESGHQVTFLVQDTILTKGDNSIWYYKKGMENAVVRLNSQQLQSDTTFRINSAEFNPGGKYIQFTLEKGPEKELVSDPNIVQIDIWNYKDSIIRSAQLSAEKKSKIYTGFISVGGGAIAFLENDLIKMFHTNNDVLLVYKSNGPNNTDRFWETKNNKDKDSIFLVNFKDDVSWLNIRPSKNEIFFSPDGQYLIYFDADQNGSYFSYDVKNRTVLNISEGVPAWQLAEMRPNRVGKENLTSRASIVGWQTEEQALLVYDNYDIWKLDYTGTSKPVNITNGYGHRNHIKLYDGGDDRGNDQIHKLPKGSTLLLKGFNMVTKQQGIYQITLGGNKDPDVLDRGNYRFQYIPGYNLSYPNGVKAADTNVWVVKRESSNEPPNYFLTSDFKKYKPITDINTQQQYDWHTTEVHAFKCLDGSAGEGILYKPGNFDPKRKYPVLIVFYSQIADHLNAFQDPVYISCGITASYNPAWLMNNNYLVFVPNMKTGPLKYGPIASNVIEGAVKYLKQFPFVDGSHIGSSAHSWSAKLGAYIFTHSKSFAATCLSEGYVYANMISVALSLEGLKETGPSQFRYVEEDFEFGNLWENKMSWLDQTTVLNVDNGTSPLLLFCNTTGIAEYRNQTLQFYSSLRRLERKAWWFQYEKGDHTVNDLNEQKDFTIRYTQYFDHFLKDAPAPRWMTQSMPARLKGVESFLELDPGGNCAYSKKSECMICDAWNKQFKRNPGMFGKEIKDWALDKDIADELHRKTKAERARLDKEGAIAQKKVVDILKYGYPEDRKTSRPVSKDGEPKNPIAPPPVAVRVNDKRKKVGGKAVKQK